MFYVDEAEGPLLVYLPNVSNGNVISLGEYGGRPLTSDNNICLHIGVGGCYRVKFLKL